MSDQLLFQHSPDFQWENSEGFTWELSVQPVARSFVAVVSGVAGTSSPEASQARGFQALIAGQSVVADPVASMARGLLTVVVGATATGSPTTFYSRALRANFTGGVQVASPTASHTRSFLASIKGDSHTSSPISEGASPGLLVTFFFSEFGVPKVGLHPAVTVREAVTGAIVQADAQLDEVGDGFYRFPFAQLDPSKTYVLLANGGTALPLSDRYKSLVISLEGQAIRIQEHVAILLDIEEGGWRLENRQVVFYRKDNVTELMRFSLLDPNGDPAEDFNAFERLRVI